MVLHHPHRSIAHLISPIVLMVSVYSTSPVPSVNRSFFFPPFLLPIYFFFFKFYRQRKIVKREKIKTPDGFFSVVVEKLNSDDDR